MKTQCCIPPPGSHQCHDCPLTVPIYGEGTKPCTCHSYPHTTACGKDESWRWDSSLYAAEEHTEGK